MANLSEQVSLIVVVSFFLILVAAGIIALVLVYRRKQVEYLHEQTRIKAAFEKEILESQLAIQEKTMKSIGQELHDSIGGTLTLVKLNLNTIAPVQEQRTADKILNSTELLTKAISSLRIMSKTLHSEAVLSVGLFTAIEMELKLIDKAGIFQTSLSITGQPADLDQKKELVLFRIVQEALNNAIKHSEATKIDVGLIYEPTCLKVLIEDNGKGFDHQSVDKNPEKGSGLRNMLNRTKLIGGEMVFNNRHSGMQIQITLPIIAA